jgi:hypothetical protein
MVVQPKKLRALLAGVLALSLPACQDREVTAPAGPRAPSGPSATVVAGQPVEWRAAWHRAGQLYVFDATPEIGLNTHLPNGAYYDSQLAMMENAGVRMMRMAFYWALFDQEGDGTYARDVIADYHTRIDSALSHGIVPVLVVHGGSPGGGVVSPISPNGAAQMNPKLAAFLKFAVQEYPKVKFWQIWNEPDAGYWGQVWKSPDGCNSDRAAQGRGYAETLRIAYDTIKRYAPNDWVIAAGVTGQEQMWPDADGGCTGAHPNPQVTWDFLNAFYPLARGYFDILAVHAYGADPYTPQYGPFSKPYMVRQIMAANDDANRPLWVTEAGTNAGEYLAGDPNRWPYRNGLNDGNTFDEHQRHYYETLLNGHTASSPFQKVFGYADFAQDGGPGSPPEPWLASLNGWTAEDYGNTLLRHDLVTQRLAYQFLTSRAAQNRNPRNIDDAGGRTGSLSIDTYAEVPRDQPFTYASNDQTIVLQNLTVNTLEPTRVDFIIPIVFNVSQRGTGWSSPGWNGHTRGTPGSGVVNGFKMVNGQFPPDIQVCYTVGYKNANGWEQERCDGTPVGTGASDGRVMQAVTMRLIDPQQSGWSLCYSAYMQGAGWTYPEACDGGLAGWGGATVQAIRVHIHRQ